MECARLSQAPERQEKLNGFVHPERNLGNLALNEHRRAQLLRDFLRQQISRTVCLGSQRQEVPYSFSRRANP